MDDFILVRDATMAFEYHTTLEGELVKMFSLIISKSRLVLPQLLMI